LLTWNEPEEDIEIVGYSIYRNNVRLNEHLINHTFYLDENLNCGNYKYYVITYYANGCVSYPSNRVEETIVLGIKDAHEVSKIVIYPNPTKGKFRIESGGLLIDNIEIFDIYSRKQKIEGRKQNEIDISNLKAGIYFVKITMEKGMITKKVIKYEI
jgi:hypothetical protein